MTNLGLGKLIGELPKDRRKRILEFFEQAGRQIRRQAFVDLVSSFEYDLFKSIGMATSAVRHTLNEHYAKHNPFYVERGELARTVADFSNLGGYKRLLARNTVSNTDPRKSLWEVVSHRDFLAHGERWMPLADSPTVEFAYETLSGELDRVVGRKSS